MIPFTESLRYTHYDLKPDSVVIDAGCFEGTFSRIISQNYGCEIAAFEPIREFYDECCFNLAGHPNIRVFNYALGAANGDDIWRLKGNMTGLASGGEKSERVIIRDVTDVMTELGILDCDLFKINCEGSEYQIIKRLIDTCFINGVYNLQVQWHSVIPNAQEIREELEERLLATHERTWERGNFDNGWDNFRMK